ncbi:NADPH dehydrogenase [Thermodesulfobium narugense DSM 14796]|uniref:NADPH dehydrogenase n=1 Tax=Thermodesulfobium narugense DSM 14796 TaxID=747365 RepID=M1E6I4_9BACT|nr:NADH:flavin oxidoreductase [Thermodesulfobium narugense]AEE14183.1 NADPH dehydrogenase [Thermodesulfobium narugense DSM 14796]
MDVFSPFKIKSLNFRNRFIRSATHDWMGNEDGSISERQLNMFKELAKGEVGLIVSGHSCVEFPRGRAGLKQNRIDDDRFIEGYKKLADVIHENNSLFAIQISHAGLQTNKDFTNNLDPIDHNTMDKEDINTLVEAFTKAAVRVRLSGADAVCVHMAHGYFLCRTLFSDSNKREDEFGKSIANRSKIALKLIDSIRKALGEDYPIFVKLNSTGGTGEGNISTEELVGVATLLEEHGVDLIEISGGAVGSKENPIDRLNILKIEDEGYFLERAKVVRKNTNTALSVVGGIRSLSLMNEIIGKGFADFISLSRPFIREPDLVIRLKSGQEKVSCISCSKCRNFEGIRCVFNK